MNNGNNGDKGADLITFSSPLVPSSAKVLGFRGAEAISRPYEHAIFLMAPSDDLDPGALVGERGALSIDRASDKVPPLFFSGVVASVETLHEVDGRSLIRLTLVPRLARLALGRHSRIFTKVTLPNVIQTILAENGFTPADYELRLGGYEVEEHICQYRESDLDFISRWMEREGVYYFFEHGADGERLVLCDGLSYDPDPAGGNVRYRPGAGGDTSAGEALRTFTARHATLPSKVVLGDYDYARPNLPLTGTADVARRGAGVVSLFGERFFTPSAGERLARLRAEELRAREMVIHAVGSRLHLRPGYTFELDEHPRAALNARYVTIDAHYEANQSGGGSAFAELSGLAGGDVFMVDLHAIPAGVQFRPEQKTPWPRVYGFETGNVDGPATSDYAQIDDQGRYCVKLKFDESGLAGGKASTWVRMMQPHGGGVEGFHFPLRRGTEVVIAFLGGDPDRPVIAGVVPNALTPSPVTSGNHTTNVIQTGGKNRIELEDQAGEEQITISTPYAKGYVLLGCPKEGHELVVHTDENALVDANLNYDVNVGVAPAVPSGEGNMRTVVKNNMSASVEEGDKTLLVKTGGYFIGIQNGLGVNVMNGVHFIVNNDGSVPKSAFTKGFYVYVRSEPVHVEAKDSSLTLFAKELITMKSTANNVEIEGEEVKITSRSTHTVNILGKVYEVKQQDTREEIHGNEETIKYGNSISETHGNSFEKTYGNSASETHGDAASITHGTTADMHYGKAMSYFYGEQMELTMSKQTSVAVAIKSSLEFAIATELNFGLKLTNDAAEIKIKGLVMDKAAAAISDYIADINNNAAYIKRAGLTLVT